MIMSWKNVETIWIGHKEFYSSINDNITVMVLLNTLVTLDERFGIGLYRASNIKSLNKN